MASNLDTKTNTFQIIGALALGTCLAFMSDRKIEAYHYTVPGDLVIEGMEFTCGHYEFAQEDVLKFRSLVEDWYIERGITSSISDMITCRSYLAIIGMGDKALPLIISQIESEGDDPDHWFVALESITGTNPVPAEDNGDTTSMASYWLSWAKENNVR